MKHRFTRLFSLLMIAAMSMGAMAGSVSDLVAISSDWTFIADGITSNGTVKPTANTLYSDDHIFAPTANTVAINKGNSTFGGNEHLNSLRIKNAQDRLAFKVSGACTVTFYTQSHSSRGLYVSKTDNVTADEAAYAKQSVSTTVWEVELDEAGVYYLTSYEGDFYIAGFVVVFPEEVTCAAPVIAFGSWSDAENGYPVTITNNETGATLTYAIGEGTYQAYSTSFYVGSEVVVHAKAGKSGYVDAEVSATAPFHGYADATFAWAIGNESSATITSDKDTYVSQTKVTVGDSLTVGTKSNYDANNGNTMVTYVPASSNSGSVTKVMIEYSIQMLKGMMFKLKSVAYDAIKDGTDNATYSWSYTVDDVESSITTVSKEDLLRNNNTSGTPALRHEETINADAGQNVTVRFYVSGFGNTKKFALSNIVIVGTISDESSSEDPTPACSAPAAPAISGTTSYTADGTISLTATCASGADASTTYTWYKGADWATASAADPVQSATTGSSGYTFTKTAVVADAGTYWCEASNGSGCEAHNTTGYAITVTAGQQYTITYNANEGIGSMSNTTGSGSVTLQKNSYTKDGYVFIGWATTDDRADAYTVDYNDEDSYSLSADATLYAVWGSYAFAPTETSGTLTPNATVETSAGGTMKVVGLKESGSISYDSNGLKFGGSGADSVRITLEGEMQAGTIITAKIYTADAKKARGLNLLTNSGTSVMAMTRKAIGDTIYRYVVTAGDGLNGTKVFRLQRSDNAFLKSLTVINTALPSAGLAYDPVSNEITQGDSWSAPSLVNPHSVTIASYASDNESVATVTNAGVIALAGGTGTAHINAHFAGDATYSAGDAVYTITVNAPTPEVPNVFGVTRAVANETSTASDSETTAYKLSEDALVDAEVDGVTIAMNYGSQEALKNQVRTFTWYNGTEAITCYAESGEKSYSDRLNNGGTVTQVNALNENCYYGFDLTVATGKKLSISNIYADVMKSGLNAHYIVKVYNNDALIKTLDEVVATNVNSNMIQSVNTEADEALQDLTGTVTLKMFFWDENDNKYIEIKDFNVTVVVENNAGEGVTGLVFTDFSASANPSFTEGEVTAVWTNNANNVSPASDNRGIRVQYGYDYTMTLTVPNDSYISEVVFVWNKNGNKNNTYNPDYYINLSVKNSSDEPVSSLQQGTKVNETAWSCGELRESELKFVQGAGDFYCHSIRVTYLKLSYARIHPHMNLNTLCFPFAISSYTGATFYDILNTEVEDGNLTALTLVEHVGALTAGVPYFYDPSGTELVCYYGGDAVENPGTAAGGAFVGTFADNSAVPAGSYVTVNNQLYKCGAGVTMGTYRAYVSPVAYDGGAPAPGRRILRIGGNKVPTGVENNGEWLMVNGECQKIIRDGQILIIRDGRTYNVMGQEVR